MKSTTVLMRCGPGHPRTFDVPANAEIVNDRGIVDWVLVEGQPLRCTVEGCRRQMRLTAIMVTESKVSCGLICREAVSATCKCSCGGRNHGKEAEA